MTAAPGRMLELARQLEVEVWGRGRFDLLDEIATPGYTIHDVGLGVTISGRDAVREDMRSFSATFAIAEVVIEDAVTGDAGVAVRWRLRATHVAEHEGVAATGREVEYRGMDLLQAEDGLLVEAWVIASDLDLMRQISDEARPC